ncbi:MAG: Demethylmenaquinone methyltransferase [Alphaproteobacteria bacterium MarineAlpha4_Bin2]|nr:MAG: Demethylmenaquinone methyltransferase [Alphaproteobacteria bacterium MarineAlpha4_Bin2]
MELNTYYRDHWVEIEDERLDRYEHMFQWSPAFERLLEPADIREGHIVGDLGCGPGFLSMQLLDKVGPTGRVHSFDVSADFIERTKQKAEATGAADNLTLHHLKSDVLPIQDATLDRIIAKNVLVYVDDPLATFHEFRRVLKPGGKVHAIDSDFAMVAIDPVPPADWRELLDAAAHAFQTPNIGRKLFGLARMAGFTEVDIKIIVSPDTKGRLLNFAKNIAGYAREAGTMDEIAIQRVLKIATSALKDGNYFAVNPQFVITATI